MTALMSVILFSQKKRFSLNGKEIQDDSNMGPLFTGDALELKDTKDWRDISYIRVGEEGRQGWSETVEVSESTPPQIKDILKKRQGWFYIRIYDESVKLIDSFDFRRIIGLEAILRDGQEHSTQNIMIPSKNGYKNVTVKFAGENISVEREEDKKYSKIDNNTTTIEPYADGDTTHWRINEKTKVTIQMPRIWWRMDKKGEEPAEWRDIPFEMSRKKFSNHSNASLVIRLPLEVQKVYIGFSPLNFKEGQWLKLTSNKGETKRAEMRLYDFAFYAQIKQPLSAQASLCIQCKLEEVVVELPIIHILADKTPTEPDNPPTPLPPQSIYRPDKNKGFSKGELHQAGFNNADITQLKIACDQRRRTIHPHNIEKLHGLKGENHAK